MEHNVYNQLVKDNVPKILKEKGSKPHTRTLNDHEYISELEISLDEYVARYTETGGMDELADIAELVFAIAKFKGYDQTKFNNLIADRKKKYGGYDKRTYLLNVDEEDEDIDAQLKALGEMRPRLDLYATFVNSEDEIDDALAYDHDQCGCGDDCDCDDDECGCDHCHDHK